MTAPFFNSMCSLIGEGGMIMSSSVRDRLIGNGGHCVRRPLQDQWGAGSRRALIPFCDSDSLLGFQDGLWVKNPPAV